MIHTDENQATFHYFASILRENNSDIENILFVGSDRQHTMENGLARKMPTAQFLSCKKHVEDNVKMKMAALGILNKSDFLVDIFGDTPQEGLLTQNLMRTLMQDCCILKRFGELHHKGINFTPIFLSTSQMT